MTSQIGFSAPQIRQQTVHGQITSRVICCWGLRPYIGTSPEPALRPRWETTRIKPTTSLRRQRKLRSRLCWSMSARRVARTWGPGDPDFGLRRVFSCFRISCELFWAEIGSMHKLPKFQWHLRGAFCYFLGNWTKQKWNIWKNIKKIVQTIIILEGLM